MKLYVDTSLLFSYYASDAHSARADRWRQARPFPLFFTALQRVELRNALELSVFFGRSKPAVVALAWRTVEEDLQAGFLAGADLDLNLLASQAETLLQAHTAQLGIRSLDLLHVAAALLLNADEFATFDLRQAALARKAGLAVAAL